MRHRWLAIDRPAGSSTPGGSPTRGWHRAPSGRSVLCPLRWLLLAALLLSAVRLPTSCPQGTASARPDGSRALTVVREPSRHWTWVIVPASAAFVDTGVFLEQGETFVVEATGSWTMVTDDREYISDADGAKACVYGSGPLGVLLGRVAGLPGPATLVLGRHAQREAPATGILYLNANHLWWLRDAQRGQLTVRIRGGRPATPQLRSRCKDADLAAIRERILHRCNTLRQRMGLPQVTSLPSLERAAQAHAEYVDRHDYSHTQQRGKEGFLGEQPWDRMRACGYHGPCGEVIASEDSAEEALEIWVASVYHRQFITNPALSAIGMGVYGRIQVLTYGLQEEAPTTAVALYPPAEEREVPLSWPGLESPSPIPAGAPTPVGYTVSAHFPAEVKRVHRMQLREVDGAEVPCYARHRLNDEALRHSNSVFLLPQASLAPGKTYQAMVAAETAAGDQEVQWTFTTTDVVPRALEPEPQFIAPRRPVLSVVHR